MADVWTDLLFFESRDLAGRSYRLLHKRPLSAAKAAEIIANLAQARGYFKSASSADDLVRPLLLYYGVLALARSLVLFLDRDKREASMHQAHGLITSGWDKTLTEATESAAKRLRRLPELAVEFPAGAFSEFIEATGNVERSYVNVGPFPDRRWLERPRPLDLARPFKITLKDVLARIPELSDSFERGFEARSAAWFSVVFATGLRRGMDGVQVDFSVYETRYGGRLESEVIRTGLGLDDGVEIREREESNWLEQKNQWFRIDYLTEPDFEADLPAISLDPAGHTFLIPPIGENHFSKMALLFIAAYVFGMLARYFPSYWLALLNRSEGDFFRPVVQEALGVIEDQFPKHVLNELENRSG